jgi:hypothetical protein
VIPAAPHLTPAQQAALAAEEERPLSAAAFEARVRVPWSAQEGEDFDRLVRWFRRRYPTAGARLAMIRRRMQQLTARR